METDSLLHLTPREAISRPGYSDSLAKRLFKYMNVKPGDRVLEIAAGTGKWTEKLVGAGLDVTVVEPSRQRRLALSARFPNIKTVEAVAEALPFARGSFDHVFIATAFHGFHVEVVYKEILRVLKPTGGLGLLWTTWTGLIPDWYRDVLTLVAPFESDAPKYIHMNWRSPFDDGDEFKMLQFERHDVSRPIRTVDICERFLSTSAISALPELIFNALKKQIEGTLERYILKGQIFKMPEELHMYWTKKV